MQLKDLRSRIATTKVERALYKCLKEIPKFNQDLDDEEERINAGNLMEDIADTPEEYPEFGIEFHNQEIETKTDQLNNLLKKWKIDSQVKFME